MHIELLKLNPVVKDYIWGGKKLNSVWNKRGGEKIAETWELSLHPDGLTTVEGGTYDGKTLKELLNSWPIESSIGKSLSLFPMFPMIIKLLDTSDKLSIQVHPGDDYAHKHENQYGKSEAWYILDAEPGAGVYLGFKQKVTKAQVIQSINDGNLLDLMQFYPAQPGNIFYIPAGTVHTMTAGLTVAEVQQNSNVTYRLFDYNRVGKDGKPRELHIEKALDVANLGPYEVENPKIEKKSFRQLVKDRYFSVKEVTTSGIYKRKIDDSFCAILFLEGKGEITDSIVKYEFKKGETYFVPATLPFKITGDAKFLEVSV
ncbi:MAG TPA: type I phosphomannose isomerase catalytic subunit [Clostridia bacterium]